MRILRRGLLCCLAIPVLIGLTATLVSRRLAVTRGPKPDGVTRSIPPHEESRNETSRRLATREPPATTSSNVPVGNQQVLSHPTKGLDAPMSFEPNLGQAGRAVKYIARASQYTVELRSNGAVLSLRKATPIDKTNERVAADSAEASTISMQFDGANPQPTVEALEPTPSKSNYFLGSDPKAWRTGVPNYSRVRYSSVYPGIDVVYYGDRHRLEYDVVVAPGADASRVSVALGGTKSVHIAQNGDLVLQTPAGPIRQLRPAAFQDVQGAKREVECRYKLDRQGHVKLNLGQYDRERELVIDPVLEYSSYLGGSGMDQGNAVAVDPAGNVYVTGYTGSTDFPISAGALQTTKSTSNVTFVTEFNPSGSAIIFSTYLGGIGDSRGNAIALDSAGNIYVAGDTSSSNFPVTSGSLQTTFHGGGGDAVLTKLNPSGSSLVYSTYVGGTGYETCNGLAVDSAGFAVIAGRTSSTDFPSGAFGAGPQPTNGGGDDGFVARVNADGTALTISSYLGGNGTDYVNAMAVDSSGNVYLAGLTSSTNFPVTPGAFQTAKTGLSYIDDAFVVKWAGGNTWTYATYLGGAADDFANGIAVDSAGNAYVTGLVESTDFPVTPGAFQTTYVGGTGIVGSSDAFITKLNPQGSALVYSTFLGGNGVDYTFGIALDSLGDACVVGQTEATDFPTTPDALQPDYGGGQFDAFVTRLNATGTALVYSTYFGGSDWDLPYGLTVDSSNNLFFTGTTYSYDIPRTSGAFQQYLLSCPDAFLAEISLDSPGYSISGTVTNDLGNPLHNVQVSLSGPVSRTASTDVNGHYSLGSLPPGGNFTITASRDSFVFDPSTVTISNLSQNQTVNFSGPAPLVIFGTIREPGTGYPGIGVTLNVTGSTNTSTTTDNNGRYSIHFLSEGGSYTITPTSSIYIFSPPSSTVSSMTGDMTLDFTAIPPPTISGKLTDESGNPFQGMTITLSGSLDSTTYTNSDGSYYFPQIPRGGNYTVTPSSPYYTFEPGPQSFTNLQSDQTVNFTILYPVNIYGQVAPPGGGGIQGATVTLTGTVNETMQTDSAGGYWFSSLPRNGDYTVTVSAPYFTFSPPSQTVTNVTTDQKLDFVALSYIAIVGYVTNAQGSNLPGVTVTLSGAASATTQTDSYGYYSFWSLPQGLTYVVTPSSPDYSFTPLSQTFANVSGGDQIQNFTGTPLKFLIGGSVCSNGNGLAGVSLTLSGDASGSTVTDPYGGYSFPGLPVGGTYTVTPSKPGYAFSPSSVTIANLTEDEPAVFTATLQTFAISGQVMLETGGALSGATITLSGSASASTTSDSQGNYSFSSLPATGSYTVTPSLAGYTFSPANSTFPNLLANQTARFTATRLTFSISGRLADGSGNGLSSATVTLSGGQSATTATDANGNYLFSNVPAAASYAVTPSKNHYAFSPASSPINNLLSNATANFTGTLLTSNITGHIADSGGNSVAGVTVSLSGSQSGATSTDANGNYSLGPLNDGGSYTVTPSKSFYVFTPAVQTFNDLGTNQTANFTATLLTFSISGHVTEGGVPLAGVTVSLAGPTIGTVVTDPSGAYSFSALTAGGNYSVTPQAPFYAFAPAVYTVAGLSANQTADFLGSRLLYQVGGTVVDVCSQPVPGVTLTLTHDSVTATATTDSNGSYLFTGVQAGFNYSLTPSLDTYSFNPVFAAFSPLASDQAASFTAIPATSVVQIAPTADAYVRAGSNANHNYGTATTLISALSTNAGNTYQTFIKFDLGQVCSASSVKLQLFGHLNNNKYLNVPVSAYSVSDTSWTETGITWNNQAAIGSLLATTTIANSTNASYQWDITAYVQSELAAGRHVITIALTNPSVTSNQAVFNSREANTNKPALVVTTP